MGLSIVLALPIGDDMLIDGTEQKNQNTLRRVAVFDQGRSHALRH
jgi:hypothetical protein